MGFTSALWTLRETHLEILTRKSSSLFTVSNKNSCLSNQTVAKLYSRLTKSAKVSVMCLTIFLTSLRLANGVVHHHRNPPAHHALLHLLLPVLPSEMLLLCPLSLLPPTVLLSRKR